MIIYLKKTPEKDLNKRISINECMELIKKSNNQKVIKKYHDFINNVSKDIQENTHNNNISVGIPENTQFNTNNNNILQEFLRKIFNWNKKEIEIIYYKGKFYFKGKEVAEILDYEDTSQAIRNHVLEKYQKKFYYFLPRQNNGVEKKEEELNVTERTIYISEAGLYSLIFKSHQPKAIEFQEWIMEDVLPGIRDNYIFILKNNNNFLI